MMKVLWLIQSYEIHSFDLLAKAIAEHMTVDLVPLSKDEQNDLATTLRKFNFNNYDRVMTTLRSKKEMRQWQALRHVHNHVIFEYDSCQNYIPGAKYEGQFSRYYRRLGGPRLVVSGFGVTERLRSEGFDAHFLPKGYDSRLIRNEHGERDILIGFIGKLDASVYAGRRAVIERAVNQFGLKVITTSPGTAYAKTLNRLRIFLSADIGLGEYMAKNFEAMGAGCTLVAYSQGDAEDRALGLIDMHNVMLYRNIEELSAKLPILLADRNMCERIAATGEKLARASFAYDTLGDRLARILQEPLLPKQIKMRFGDRFFWR